MKRLFQTGDIVRLRGASRGFPSKGIVLGNTIGLDHNTFEKRYDFVRVEWETGWVCTTQQDNLELIERKQLTLDLE